MAYRLAQLAFASLVLPAVLALPSPHAGGHQQMHEKRQRDGAQWQTEWEVHTEVVTVTGGAPAPTSTSTSAFNPVVASPSVQASAGSQAAGSASVSSASASSTGTSTNKNGVPSGPGICYNNAGGDLSAYGAAKWGWNWDMTTSGYPALPGNAVFVPCLKTGGLEAAFKTAVSGHSAMIGYNEPDAPKTFLDHGTAAAGYQTVDTTSLRSNGMQVGTPQITSTDGQGIPWLQSFVSSCTGKCSFDFFAIHWYATDNDDPTDAANKLDAYLTQFRNSFPNNANTPIWLTEFGYLETSTQTTAAQKVTFLNNIVPKFSSHNVVNWSFFMAGNQDHAGMGFYNSPQLISAALSG